MKDVESGPEPASDYVAPVEEVEKSEHPELYVNRPRDKFYDRGLKLFGYQFPAYSSAFVQLIMVSFVCFMCPGMFNALSGLGGNGLPPEFVSLADKGNVALYSVFAGVGFFSGTILNRLGAKWCLSLGGLGYAFYSSAYLCFNYTQNQGYVIAAGAVLGLCASMLWAGQGAIIMSYPTEEAKGRYVAIFWIIFNVGAVIGAIVPLAETAHTNEATSVSSGTYGAFLALMFIGAVIALFMLPTDKVVKADGTRVIVKEHPSWWSEIKALLKVLVKDPQIILLFPMFFTSNFFYTYQFNAFNALRFDVRTRSLNSMLYWMAQIVGAYLWGWWVLDLKFWDRKRRARVYHGILFVLTMVIWGGGYAFEKTYTRESVADMKLLDWSDSYYPGPVFMYIFYGMYDAIFQTYVYWLMGSLSNSARKVALFAGFYKGLQSAGAAVAWRIDSLGVPINAIFGTCWGLCAGSLLIGLPCVWFYVQEHTDVEVDLAFTEDKTVEEVSHHLDKSSTAAADRTQATDVPAN